MIKTLTTRMPEKLPKVEIKNWQYYENKETGVKETWDVVLKKRVFNTDEFAARERIEKILDGTSKTPLEDMRAAMDGIYLNEIVVEYPEESMELLELLANSVRVTLAQRIGKDVPIGQLMEDLKFLHNVFVNLDDRPKPKNLSRSFLQAMFLDAAHEGGIVSYMSDNMRKIPGQDKKKGGDAGDKEYLKVFYRIVSMAVDRAGEFKNIDEDERSKEQQGVIDLVKDLEKHIDAFPPGFQKKITSLLY